MKKMIIASGLFLMLSACNLSDYDHQVYGDGIKEAERICQLNQGIYLIQSHGRWTSRQQSHMNYEVVCNNGGRFKYKGNPPSVY